MKKYLVSAFVLAATALMGCAADVAPASDVAAGVESTDTQASADISEGSGSGGPKEGDGCTAKNSGSTIFSGGTYVNTGIGYISCCTHGGDYSKGALCITCTSATTCTKTASTIVLGGTLTTKVANPVDPRLLTK